MGRNGTTKGVQNLAISPSVPVEIQRLIRNLEIKIGQLQDRVETLSSQLAGKLGNSESDLRAASKAIRDELQANGSNPLSITKLPGVAAQPQVPQTVSATGTVGGVEAYTAPAHQWINKIGTDGTVTSTQPQASDIAGLGGAATSNTGNLVESTSDVLVIVGGTNAVLGSGTSIQVKQASGSQDGYLSSGDWAAFNSKQGALSVTNDTNVTGSVAGGVLTLGWTGTLAAARLNSNVVQAVTNDTNITGSIANQILTLGFTGTLAAARLNANVVQAVINDTNVTGSIASQTLTLGWSGQLSIARGGTGASTAAAALTNLGGASLSANNTFTGTQTVTASRVLFQLTNTGNGNNLAVHYTGKTATGVSQNAGVYFAPNDAAASRLIGLSVDDNTYQLQCDVNGNTTITGTLKAAGLQVTANSTGSGSAALGANCPAITPSAPYTWIKVTANDGSTVYIPAWK
jgi:hypothetical protein